MNNDLYSIQSAMVQYHCTKSGYSDTNHENYMETSTFLKKSIMGFPSYSEPMKYGHFH